MSSRLKDRGGDGAKIMAANPNKALIDSTPKERKLLSSATRKAPVAGKENTAAAGVPRRSQLVPAVRWSTSSVPRGKSPSPLDRDPGSRVRVSEKIAKPGANLVKSVTKSESRSSSVTRNGDSGAKVRVLEKSNESGGQRGSFDANLVKSVAKSGSRSSSVPRNGDSGSRVRVSEKSVKPGGLRSSLDSSLVKSSGRSGLRLSSEALIRDLGKNVNLGSGVKVSEKNAKNNVLRRNSFDPSFGKMISKSGLKLSSETQVRDLNENKVEKTKPNSLQSCSDANLGKVIGKDKVFVSASNKSRSEEDMKASDCVKVVENSSEKVVEEKVVQAVNKYSSKLHEKLALLEGRVQRIASDIKKTKEMLEVNNEVESKSILSDIQQKISGIEKAVGSVMDTEENSKESVPSEIAKKDNFPTENVTTRSGCSVKGLNLVELEARFFPHQKLIKNRTSTNGSMSPVDENPIAVEFLASLDSKAEITGVQAMGAESTSAGICAPTKADALQCEEEVSVSVTEKFEEFGDAENKQKMLIYEEAEDSIKDEIFEIGHKSSTGGWFVSEGEAVLLTHSDGYCSYYDIGNCEEKAEYKPPETVSTNMWSDCWIIRAPGADGSSGRYVVAASAGNTLEAGFCSWDFYTKIVQAHLVESGTPSSVSIPSSRSALAPLTNTGHKRRSASCSLTAVENQQYWYRPCGPLLISTSSQQRGITAYDIRDGDLVMKWDVTSPVVGMEHSSPIQWRSRGKVIVAESEAISLWDVNSTNPQPLLSVSLSGKKISCLHVNNTDAEIGGGVRQRMRSSEVEGNDGVFCTQDSINVFDFRLPSGVGLKMSGHGFNANSIFSSGDSIFIGTTETKLSLRNSSSSRIQQFSLRKGKLTATYALPDSNSHGHHSSISQVWGNSSFVMGICGMGLFVFDANKDEPMPVFSSDRASIVQVKERIGPDDLYCPTFDYSSSRALIISRDRPAMWRYM